MCLHNVLYMAFLSNPNNVNNVNLVYIQKVYTHICNIKQIMKQIIFMSDIMQKHIDFECSDTNCTAQTAHLLQHDYYL